MANQSDCVDFVGSAKSIVVLKIARFDKDSRQERLKKINNRFKFLLGNELDLDVVKLVRHENFTYDTHDNDIALLKLARPVELDMLTRPACLPERFSNEIPDKECFVTGWGKLSVDGETATKLQVAKVRITSHAF